MDGEAVIRALLVADSGLTALVAAENIVADMLPVGTTLPAISIENVSGNDRNVPAPGTTRHVDERIQVTVAAKTKPQQKQVLRAIRSAAADFIGSIAGLTDVTVQTASAGPSYSDEQASIRFGSQDFIVGYTEIR